jgi:tetratricopeptide (TPR) repeat protein
MAEVRAEIGDAPGALRAAVAIPNSYSWSIYKVNALRSTARAQVRTGDLKGALRTADRVRSLIASWQAEASPDFRKSLTACGSTAAILAVEKSRVLIEIGTTQVKAGDRAGAARTLHQAMRDLEAAGVRSPEGGVMWLLANALADAGDYPAARRAASFLKDDFSRKNCLLHIVAVQADAGDMKGALETAGAVRSSPEQDALQALFAGMQAYAGKMTEARRTADAIHDPGSLVQALMGIARSQLKRGDRNGAAETLRRALRITEGIKKPADPSEDKDWLLTFIAEAQAEVGDNDGAVRTAESVWDDRLGVPSGRLFALGRVAAAQARAGNRQEAARTIERASRVAADRERGWLISFQAQAGDAGGALAQANRERDPERRATYLLKVAEGMRQRAAEQKARAGGG